MRSFLEARRGRDEFKDGGGEEVSDSNELMGKGEIKGSKGRHVKRERGETYHQCRAPSLNLQGPQRLRSEVVLTCWCVLEERLRRQSEQLDVCLCLGAVQGEGDVLRIRVEGDEGKW